MGRNLSRLSHGGVRLSRGSRRLLPSESLACGCARRPGDGGLQGRARVGSIAGVGLFARRLAASFDRVVPSSRTRGTGGSRTKPERHKGRGREGDALAFLRSPNKGRPDLIVVDPPRAGLGAEITALIGSVAALELVYVSCDPATLARDLRLLMGSGYVIESVTLADLFPQTFHWRQWSVAARLIGLISRTPSHRRVQCNRNRQLRVPLYHVLHSRV